MTVVTFVLAGLLLLMACVPADRVRAWRTARHPGAPEVSGAAFAVGRLLLVTMAVLGIVTGFRGLSVQDDAEWSDEELTSAVEGATGSLDGSSATGLPGQGPETAGDFDGFALRVEEEIAAHGAGDAPRFGVDAEPADDPTANRARYAISARGATVSFCMHVTRRHSGYTETVAPGGLGESSKVRLPTFSYAVRTSPGTC
ncbi:hypothetical protein ACF09L_21080 [Streptomyces sp. NPDC014779]|uniref:hypothetical protein n=1 Tax=unclassified Streptomyces TaxID=2593676 RepID=UPI00370097E9